MLELALINNAPTPYRLHLHARLARELQNTRTYSVFTHDYSNAPWQCQVPAALNPLFFGDGEASGVQATIRNQGREWGKAGRIVRWLEASKTGAVVLGGYNDAGRIRILHWCRKRRIPCFIFGDSNVLDTVGSYARDVAKKVILPYVLRHSSGALFCGRRGYEYFERYGLSSDRLFPFPYEPDYDAIERAPRGDIERVSKRYGVSRLRRNILFSGRLVEVKRPDLLVRAFAHIAGERSEWDLVVAGDGPLRPTLVAGLPSNILQRIRFTGFIQDPTELAALYRCADALVLPSDREPWGVVVSEAAVCLALVCSARVGAAADLLVDGVNGRTFPAGNLDGLIAAMRDVTSPENIDRMKAASPIVLQEWRKRCDPIKGLQAALASVGL